MEPVIDLLAELKQIEDTNNEAKINKAKYEERINQLNEAGLKLKTEIENLGLKINEVEEWLIKEDSELKMEIDKCKKILGL